MLSRTLLLLVVAVAVVYSQSPIKSLKDRGVCNTWHPLGRPGELPDTLPYKALCEMSGDIVTLTVSTTPDVPFRGLVATVVDNRNFPHTGVGSKYSVPSEEYVVVSCQDGSQSTVKLDFSEATSFVQTWTNSPGTNITNVRCRFLLAESETVFWNDIIIPAAEGLADPTPRPTTDVVLPVVQLPVNAENSTTETEVLEPSPVDPTVAVNTTTSSATEISGPNADANATSFNNASSVEPTGSEAINATISVNATIVEPIAANVEPIAASVEPTAATNASMSINSTTAFENSTTEAIAAPSIVDENLTNLLARFANPTFNGSIANQPDSAAITTDPSSNSTNVGTTLPALTNETSNNPTFNGSIANQPDSATVTTDPSSNSTNVGTTLPALANETSNNPTFNGSIANQPDSAAITTDPSSNSTNVGTTIPALANETSTNPTFNGSIAGGNVIVNEFTIENSTASSASVNTEPSAVDPIENLTIDSANNQTTFAPTANSSVSAVGQTTPVFEPSTPVEPSTPFEPTMPAQVVELSERPVEPTARPVEQSAPVEPTNPSAIPENLNSTAPQATTVSLINAIITSAGEVVSKTQSAVAQTTAADLSIITNSTTRPTVTGPDGLPIPPTLEAKPSKINIQGTTSGYWCKNYGSHYALIEGSKCTSYYIGTFDTNTRELLPAATQQCGVNTRFNTAICDCVWATDFLCPPGM